MTSDYWQDKVCVVTGASAGLGAAIARVLAAHGATVVLVARHLEPLEQIADTLRGLGGEVLAVAADLTVQQDVENLAQQVVLRYGRVDLLCNCAGRSARGAILDTTAEDFQKLLDVNFLAAVRTTRAFAPMLMHQRGHVVQIGSLASKVAARFLGGYPASKFALAAYAQQLRMELGPEGLHVLLVCPGPIKRQHDESPRYAEEAAGLPEEAQQPGAGANLPGIDPTWLAERMLIACEKRRAELIVPWKVRVLLILAQISPRLGDWLLRRATSAES
ncbi:MAG: SDR family NAD(P)-dependent oxidoreductase [Bythopirellula sp.]